MDELVEVAGGFAADRSFTRQLDELHRASTMRQMVSLAASTR
jgi:hypothetical protein